MSTAPNTEPAGGAGRGSKGRPRRRRSSGGRPGAVATPAKDAAVAGAFNGWLFLQDAISSWGKTLRLALLLFLLLAVLVVGAFVLLQVGGDVGAVVKGLVSGAVAVFGFDNLRRWRKRQRSRHQGQTSKFTPRVLTAV